MVRFLALSFSLLVYGLFWNVCEAQVQNVSYRIAFYNVENLFDTIAHTLKDDKEFTPQSKSAWNSERYFKKINDLAEVIDSMRYPFLIGLCEVENGAVLTDLCQAIRPPYYQYIHHHSPDNRGIDAALLYQPMYFRPIKDKAIPVFIHIGEEIKGTRDILHVSGIFLPTGDTLDLFINHWPSRRGGAKESEHRRLAAADTLSRHITHLWRNRPAALPVIMGDFNDDPVNESIAKHLLGARHPSKQDISLLNMSLKAFQAGQGTYNYRGNWNMLDQIIISNAMIMHTSWSQPQFHVFKSDFILFDHPRFGPTPNRTYGGPNYYGGYSDHLPVFLEWEIKQ